MNALLALIFIVSTSAISLTGCMHDEGMRSSGSNYGARAGQQIDDGVLTTKVKTALAAHASLRTLILSVESNQGAVTITGKVRSQQLAETVTGVAAAVDGVRSVNNRLVIKPDDQD